jgi:hypothetical protein
MKLPSIVLISLLVPSLVFAQDVKYLEQGQAAPFTGYLVSPDMEKKFRLMDKKLEFSTQLNTSYENLLKSYEANDMIQNKRIEICQKQNEKLLNGTTKLDGIPMFLVGAATAILIMFAHGKINSQ